MQSGDNEAMKVITLACIVLHNTCIKHNEPFPPQLDIAADPKILERRDRDTVRNLLNMRQCSKVKDSSVQAGKIREALKDAIYSIRRYIFHPVQ